MNLLVKIIRFSFSSYSYNHSILVACTAAGDITGDVTTSLLLWRHASTAALWVTDGQRRTHGQKW